MREELQDSRWHTYAGEEGIHTRCGGVEGRPGNTYRVGIGYVWRALAGFGATDGIKNNNPDGINTNDPDDINNSKVRQRLSAVRRQSLYRTTYQYERSQRAIVEILLLLLLASPRCFIH